MEGLTATTAYNGATSFRHAETAYTSEDMDTLRNATRLFMINLTGASSPTGPLGQLTEPMDSEESVELLVVYPMGKNAFELMKIIAEDHVLIRHELMLASKWAGATTGIMRRIVEGYTIDTADGEDGSVAVVYIPVQFRYRPTFT